MSLANRLFPRAEDSKRRRQFRTLQLALILGLIVSAVVALCLYLLYYKKFPTN